MSVGESILMTVCDREPEVLMNTFRWLASGDTSDSEVIVIDDGSRADYSWIKAYEGALNLRWITMQDYPAYRIGSNYNNPAKAFNRALQEAQGERIAVMSSDVIVPHRVLDKARKDYQPDDVWCPMVVDLGTSNEYCGPHRVFPMPWFLYMSKAKVVECGGWDENFLFGMCWEDNDFLGRLALVTNQIVCDWGCVVWHQSHYQPAYEINNQEVGDANRRNRKYISTKWAGSVPFSTPDLMAFEMARGRDENTGNFALKFKDVKNLKDRVISATLSPFVDVPQAAE